MQIFLRSWTSFITNQGNSDILSGAAFLYYKVGQVMLQSSTGFKKWGNNYYKVW